MQRRAHDDMCFACIQMRTYAEGHRGVGGEPFKENARWPPGRWRPAAPAAGAAQTEATWGKARRRGSVGETLHKTSQDTSECHLKRPKSFLPTMQFHSRQLNTRSMHVQPPPPPPPVTRSLAGDAAARRVAGRATSTWNRNQRKPVMDVKGFSQL